LLPNFFLHDPEPLGYAPVVLCLFSTPFRLVAQLFRVASILIGEDSFGLARLALTLATLSCALAFVATVFCQFPVLLATIMRRFIRLFGCHSSGLSCAA